jgi:transcriptional regulator with XRE-family HTH domain
MDMPERSFGRTVRYQRTKLGLSQAKLAELVGRSSATIRSWERDKTRPNDPKVLEALAAILGVDEKDLFDKAEVDLPTVEETSPTVEQALATLKPPSTPAEARHAADPVEVNEAAPSPGPVPVPEQPARQLVGVAATPAYVAPPDPYHPTPLTPNLTELSYIEDRSQRQMYRIRTLATLVAFVALVVALIWAIGQGVGAFGEWWDGFFGDLRL